MSVDLRDFIKQTLSDIVYGVMDAQADASIGRKVAPKDSSRLFVSVTFDVAVTAETTGSAKGEGGFKVAVLSTGVSAGGEVGKASKNVAATRIQFEVPVRLPTRD